MSQVRLRLSYVGRALGVSWALVSHLLRDVSVSLDVWQTSVRWRVGCVLRARTSVPSGQPGLCRIQLRARRHWLPPLPKGPGSGTPPKHPRVGRACRDPRAAGDPAFRKGKAPGHVLSQPPPLPPTCRQRLKALPSRPGGGRGGLMQWAARGRAGAEAERRAGAGAAARSWALAASGLAGEPRGLAWRRNPFWAREQKASPSLLFVLFYLRAAFSRSCHFT